ncbi:MAG: hypothetical protein E7174_01060 [Firmicutes bacterium]|nr:hypothetical protein [Bacillota bacterium]
MSLNYNIIDTFKLLLNAFKYNIFYSIIIGCILLVIVLILNKNKRIIKYVVLGLNIVLINLIGYYYIKSILTLKFSNPINNIYFYFFNSIIYLAIMTIINFKTKYKNTNYIFYGLVLINLLYSLFMTHYLGNINLIVIGNIFPMIKLGNILYIIYYILLMVNLGGFLWKKK